MRNTTKLTTLLWCWSLWQWHKTANSLSQMNCFLTHSCFPDFCRSPILSLSLPQFSLLHPLSEGCSHPHSQNISETINSLIRTTHSYLLSQPTGSRAAFTFLRISRSIFPSAILQYNEATCSQLFVKGWFCEQAHTCESRRRLKAPASRISFTRRYTDTLFSLRTSQPDFFFETLVLLLSFKGSFRHTEPTFRKIYTLHLKGL